MTDRVQQVTHRKMRVLAIAEAANPAWVSVPLVGWSLASALREVADVHLVTHVRNRKDIERAGLVAGRDFTTIDSERVMHPLWRMGEVLRGGSGKGWTTSTAIAGLGYYYFEYLLWRQFERALLSGEYDLVHRITPLSPTIPSLLARKCRRAGIPFVLGPLNGGVAWPEGFGNARRQEREWLSYLRSAYKLMPGYRSTLQHASALLMGSLATQSEVPEEFQAKCIYLPENAIDPLRFSRKASGTSSAPLRACFVGRLVPYKGPDMLLEAAAPMMRENRLCLDIVGDGPMRPMLEDFAVREGITHAITFHGWVAHSNVQDIMCRSQVLAFPSIREFGGGVVLEAMALGIVPIVADYAGPGELVGAGTGYKIPFDKRQDVVRGFRETLERLALDSSPLAELAVAARQRVDEHYTWSAKAAQVKQVYQWVLGQRPVKPAFFAV